MTRKDLKYFSEMISINLRIPGFLLRVFVSSTVIVSAEVQDMSGPHFDSNCITPGGWDRKVRPPDSTGWWSQKMICLESDHLKIQNPNELNH